MKKKTEEYNFIKGFSKISIAGICRKLKINRSALVNGKSREEHYILVKREIEKELARLYLDE